MEPTLVVGVDFGTTFSGFAYAHRQNAEKKYSFNEWPGQDGKPYCKTQTSLYYEKHEASDAPGSLPRFELTHWGWPAQAQHLRRSVELDGGPKGVFISRFKLLLAPGTLDEAASELHAAAARQAAESFAQNELVASRSEGGVPDLEEGKQQAIVKSLLQSPDGGLNVVRTTTDFLSRLSGFVVDHLQRTLGSRVSSRDVQWCLTVPAIWEDSAKQVMRRCAQMAGMVTGPHCPAHLVRIASPHPLQIVLESEAASLYCATNSAQWNLQEGDQFLVADIGGGTTDIVVHTMASGPGNSQPKLKETTESSGDLCGGTNVDINFLSALWGQIGCLHEVMRKSPATIAKVLTRWSDIKATYDGSATTWGPAYLEIPEILAQAWRSYDQQHGVTAGDYDDIQITSEDMMQMFDPVVDRIIQLIQARVSQTPDIKLLLLVGGFSASPYLRQRVKAAFETQLGGAIVIPPDPGSAVCQGAVLFGLSPAAVTSRVSRKTYGIEQMQPFVQGVDPEGYRKVTTRGEWCAHRFSAFVRKGQEVAVDNRVKHISQPVHHCQQEIKFRIFSSDSAEVRYVTEPGVKLESEFALDISDDPRNLDLDREVEVSMFFGLSCIRVVARRLNFGQTHEETEMQSTVDI